MRPAIKVGLSTASVYPLRTEAAFEYAARLGYDGVELMVWGESVSQDIDAVERMSHGSPDLDGTPAVVGVPMLGKPRTGEAKSSPIEGARTDVEGVDIAQLQAFYHRHYRPDNATLIVSGRFDVPRTLAPAARTRLPK